MPRLFVLCTVLFATIFPSVTVNATLVDSITVAGRVINIPPEGARTIIINECDIFNKSERRVVDLDSVVEFRERIPLSFGHTFTLNYKRNLFVNAYAEPGDSIFIEIDASKSPLEFHLSGDRAELNEEYAHAFADVTPFSYNVELPADTVALAEYMPIFKAAIDSCRKLIDDYVAANSISPETARMLYNGNIYDIANLACSYRGRNPDERFAFFTDPIFDLTNPDNAKVMIFPYHLSALGRSFPEYAARLPKGVIRDIMYVVSDSETAPRRDDFSNPAYFDRVYGEENPAELDISGITDGNICVLEGDSIIDLDRVNPIDWLSRRFSGRPIYLDVSATWCGPCRESIAISESIRDHFKHSDILFAIIWLKSDMEAWTKLAPTIHNAVQIFIPDDDMANRIMGALKIHGFPSYYFIDRQGIINSDGIPSFNSSALADFLKSKI